MKLVATLGGDVGEIEAVAFVPGTTDVIVHGPRGIERRTRTRVVWRADETATWAARVAVSPTQLFTASDDAGLVERDLATGSELRRAHGVCSARALVLGGDRQQLLWGGSGVASNPGGYVYGCLELRDPATLERRWRWEGAEGFQVSGAAFTTRGILVAQGTRHPVLRLDPATGTEAKRLPARADHLPASDDGRVVVLASAEEPLRVHRDGTLVGRLPAPIDAAAISPRGRFAVVSSGGTDVTLVDVRTAQAVTTIPIAERVTALAADDAHVAIGTRGGATLVYAIADASSRTD